MFEAEQMFNSAGSNIALLRLRHQMNNTVSNQNFRGDLGRHNMSAEAEIWPEHGELTSLFLRNAIQEL